MDKTTSVTMDKDEVLLSVENKGGKPLCAIAVREAIDAIVARSKLLSSDGATKTLVEHDSAAGGGSNPSI